MTLYTRRDIAKLALASVPAAAFFSAQRSLNAAEPMSRPSKPDSKVAGVQLGINVPYSFRKADMSGDEILSRCIQLNLSAVELRSQPVEAFMGFPTAPAAPPAATPEQKGAAKEAAEAHAQRLQQWRLTAPLDQARAFRRKWEQAGVIIPVMKVDAIFKCSDPELDYLFELAKALGAHAISCEISFQPKDTARLGRFAEKHRMMVGYHGHTAITPAIWEAAFTQSKFNGANVDLGHFIAGNNYSPVEFIKKYHARITHIHLKDRKLHDGPNTPFGEGDTPVVEVLRLIRDNHWDIMGAIEFEYKVPPGSDLMTEIARSVKYCRDALA